MKSECTTILFYYGVEAQRIKAMEELSELISALARHANGSGSKIQVIEEIADVMIMCEQMSTYYTTDSELQSMINMKLERTLKRIEGK